MNKKQLCYGYVIVFAVKQRLLNISAFFYVKFFVFYCGDNAFFT